MTFSVCTLFNYDDIIPLYSLNFKWSHLAKLQQTSAALNWLIYPVMAVGEYGEYRVRLICETDYRMTPA